MPVLQKEFPPCAPLLAFLIVPQLIFLMEKKQDGKRCLLIFLKIYNILKYILHMLPYGFMADIFSMNIPTKGVNGLE